MLNTTSEYTKTDIEATEDLKLNKLGIVFSICMMRQRPVTENLISQLHGHTSK